MNVYLYFDGNCREVFDFYQGVFGGDYTMLQTFADAPPEMQVPKDAMSRVMHVALPLGASELMGSDTLPDDPPPVVGSNFSITVPADSRGQCEQFFAQLSDGGEVTMALQETFWGSYFGQCRDRFGINWMFDVELDQ